ncbi:serine peptidase [Ophiostoma piceae UAMH 11346]|uniref:Serine peptidase n=1 Tax=Ophiostoma piceae (strain UAMH 11346) TaxID=1262450 RepID=S3DBD3_OPHP1|nr:serine peptidase [Ophiostoma piceae UAMH 11346]
MKFSASLAALASASAVAAIGFHDMKTPQLEAPDLVITKLENEDLFARAAMAKRQHVRGTNNVFDARAVHQDAARLAADASSNGGAVQATFQQILNHSDPSQGTFSQRYWYNTDYWTGPGAPVVVFTPGESAANRYTGYLTNRTITGQFAKAIGGAIVMIEHRYWGESSPYAELTTKNLQHLTLANNIADITYFARNVQLGFDNSTRANNTDGGSSGLQNAPHAPWVFSGGSYAGALSAWIESVDPGTLWAYHASSAVVEAIDDFWQYFDPVRQGLPQNCSADVQLVVEHVDNILLHGSAADKQALKASFGLTGVEHDDDFASVLENGPWNWQEHDFDSGYSNVYQFCDYVENAVVGVFNTTCKAGATTPSAKGVGLKKALNGYTKWVKDVLVPGYCEGYDSSYVGTNNVDCFNTYDATSPFYTDISLDNAVDRQWVWLLCNEPFGFWQDGAPEGTPTVVSRLVTAEYWQRQCPLYFPDEDGYTFGSSPTGGKTVADTNAYTGGWFHNTTRLIWANGEFDPWKDATVSSDFRPGGALVSTPEAPVNVIPGGIHCSDLIMANAQQNAGVAAVVADEIAVIKAWVEEFYTK